MNRRVPLHNGERWLISGGGNPFSRIRVRDGAIFSGKRLRTGSDRFIQTRTNRGHCRKLGWICWPARCPRFPKFNFVRLLCIFITDSNNTWPAERECVSKIVKFVFFDNIAPRYTLRGNMRGENGWKANGIKLVKLRIFLFFPNLFFTSSKKFFLEHDLRFQRNV